MLVAQRMLAEPFRWERYYEGDADEQRIARRFSYSDRMRYYWPDPEKTTAIMRPSKTLNSTLEAAKG